MIRSPLIIQSKILNFVHLKRSLRLKEKLLEALKLANKAEIEKILLAEPMLVNTVFLAETSTSFELALRYGYKSIAVYLMSVDGFRLDQQDHNPLRIAIELGFTQIATELLELGASPNYRPQHISSALLLCLESEYYDLAELMISKGAEVDIRNDNGWTPLIWASIKGRDRAVKFLLKHGASIDVCNNDGWNAITGAYFKQRLKIVSLLQEKGAVFSTKYSEAALLSAYKNHHIDLANELIDSGVSPNVEDTEGNSLLALAITNCDVNFANTLIEKGARLNFGGEKSGVLFKTAAILNLLDVLKHMLKYGFNVNTLLQSKELVGHFLYSQGYGYLLPVLIANGLVVDAPSGPERRTLLMVAAKKNDLEMVKILIDNGASQRLLDSKGNTASSLCCHFTGLNISNYLSGLSNVDN